MFANDDSADSWFYDTSQAPYVFSAINYTHSGTFKDIDDGKFLDNFSEMLANQIDLNLDYNSVPDNDEYNYDNDVYNYIINNTDNFFLQIETLIKNKEISSILIDENHLKKRIDNIKKTLEELANKYKDKFSLYIFPYRIKT